MTMKRVRKILNRTNPGALIDLHSANQFNPRDGFANSANLYLEHFPYLDRLWFGEYFDYNSSPDFWLIEVSGIPYGLMGEMLQDGGNRWRGMLYGMNDRLKRTRLMDGQISRQQVISVEYGSTSNGAETANEYAGFVTYNLGYLYRFKNTPIDGLNLLAGSSVRAAAGCIYNTRNGNNPVSGKADIDLNLSGMAIYNFHIGNYPLTLRYQMEVPFAGILFSVHKGQPYYFVSQEGYTDGLTKITSLGNKFMMKNYFSLDFPVGAFTVRVGYLNNIYRTDINDIKTHEVRLCHCPSNSCPTDLSSSTRNRSDGNRL